MDEDKDRIKAAAALTRDLRRKYNNLLVQVVEGHKTEYNIADLARLLGELECLYLHLHEWVASGDSSLLCCLKHGSCALILAGEMDEPELEPFYELLAIISNGIIEPCQSCVREKNNE